MRPPQRGFSRESKFHLDVMATPTGSGSYYGLKMSGSSWTLDKFTSQDNAYSLCTFTGEFSTYCNLIWAYLHFTHLLSMREVKRVDVAICFIKFLELNIFGKNDLPKLRICTFLFALFVYLQCI